MSRWILFSIGFTLIAALIFQNCGRVHFAVGEGKADFNNPFGNQCSINNLLIQDSFERANVDDSSPGNVFGWHKIVNDLGVLVGSSGNQINAKTYTSSEMGVAADGSRSLFFYGRPGSSVHNVYLISKPMDLGGYDELGISFKYLPIALEHAASGPEYIRLEVCTGTADDCGAGANPDANALNSNYWQTLFDKQGPVGNGLDGRNHNLSDWLQEVVKIDLNQFNKSEFIFRFNILLDEGFNQYSNQTPILTSGMEDGAAIDEVVAATINCN